MDRQQLLEQWSFPHMQRYGVTLVNRDDAAACLKRIYSESCNFLGYDAFTVHPDGKIQPHLAHSDDFGDGGKAPSLDEIVERLRNHPPEVTHYEFVFTSAT